MPDIKQRQLQVLDILMNFNFYPKVSNAVLESYCTRKGYEILTAGEYEDHLFQYHSDERAKTLTPLIIGILAEYQHCPEHVSDSAKKSIREHNDELEVRIANLCAENGMQYREIEVLFHNLSESVGATLRCSANRMTNMCAVVFSTLAQDTFGEEIKLRDVQEWHENRVLEMSGQ